MLRWMWHDYARPMVAVGADEICLFPCQAVVGLVSVMQEEKVVSGLVEGVWGGSVVCRVLAVSRSLASPCITP